MVPKEKVVDVNHPQISRLIRWWSRCRTRLHLLDSFFDVIWIGPYSWSSFVYPEWGRSIPKIVGKCRRVSLMASCSTHRSNGVLLRQGWANWAAACTVGLWVGCQWTMACQSCYGKGKRIKNWKKLYTIFCFLLLQSKIPHLSSFEPLWYPQFGCLGCLVSGRYPQLSECLFTLWCMISVISMGIHDIHDIDANQLHVTSPTPTPHLLRMGRPADPISVWTPFSRDQRIDVWSSENSHFSGDFHWYIHTTGVNGDL